MQQVLRFSALSYSRIAASFLLWRSFYGERHVCAFAALFSSVDIFAIFFAARSPMASAEQPFVSFRSGFLPTLIFRYRWRLHFSRRAHWVLWSQPVFSLHFKRQAIFHFFFFCFIYFFSFVFSRWPLLSSLVSIFHASEIIKFSFQLRWDREVLSVSLVGFQRYSSSAG